MKTCKKCAITQEEANFRTYPKYVSGMCIACENEYRRNWRRLTKQRPLYEREKLIAEGSNKCFRCDVIKPLAAFKKSKRVNTGFVNVCKECMKYQDKFHKLKSAYGITLEDFHNILHKQNNVCAICMSQFDSPRNICVDHNHNTKEVRGILCNNCNRGIGLLKDNSINLLRAYKYLKLAQNKSDENGETLEKDNTVPSR